MTDGFALHTPLALAVFLILGTSDLSAQRSSPVDRPAHLSQITPEPRNQVLQIQQAFDRYDFWDNRDSNWFGWQIPLFECPDRDLTEIYYYRWELVTKHLVYGSPIDGYASVDEVSRHRARLCSLLVSDSGGRAPQLQLLAGGR
jgi:hypothetical protein